jgi:hypothetical protein
MQLAFARLQAAIRKLVECDGEGLQGDEATQQLYRALRLH